MASVLWKCLSVNVCNNGTYLNTATGIFERSCEWEREVNEECTVI
jgi:hypothetical protein